MSDTDDSGSSRANEESEEEYETENVIDSIFQPYQYEPLASQDEESDEEDEDDEDGIPFATLEARSENRDPASNWCKCGQCNVEQLIASREYRCCHEVQPAIGLMLFDASIEHHSCITQHEDFAPLVNRTVLKQAGPLFRDKNGRMYRRKGNLSENEYLRAVAYRWLIRWLCGYIGWDKSRPLPACLYHYIRTKFPSTNQHGYASSRERSN